MAYYTVLVASESYVLLIEFVDFDATVGKAFQVQNNGGWKQSNSLTSSSWRPQGGMVGANSVWVVEYLLKT